VHEISHHTGVKYSVALPAATLAALPLASSPASAQILPQLQLDNDSFDFDYTLPEAGPDVADMSFHHYL